MPAIQLKGVYNLRDLGGLAAPAGTLRSGLLLRSGHLHDLPPKSARALAKHHRIAHVIDLRTATEREQKPDVAVPGATVHHLPLFDESRVGITRDRMSLAQVGSQPLSQLIPDLEDLYRSMAGEECRANLAAVTRAMLEALAADEPVLFHCSEGKDRTGIVSLAVLSALGVPFDQIMADYLLTNQAVARKARVLSWLVRVLKRDPHAALKLKRVFTAEEAYLQAARDQVLSDWGGVETWVRDGLGIDRDLLLSAQSHALE